MNVINHIPGYFPINLKSQGRSFPQVFVKEYLLDKRFRGEIGGYLLVENQKICLPLGEKIYIGSSPHCHIFVNYPHVPKHQAYVLAGEDEIIVMHLAEGGVTMLADISEKTNNNLYQPLTGRRVVHDGILAIQLMNQELPLIFEVKIERKEVKPLFYFPEIKPSIDVTSPTSLEDKKSPALKINLARYPRFAGAATAFDLADIYYFHLNQIRREEAVVGRILNAVSLLFSIGAVILSMVAISSIPFTAPLALFMFMVSTGYENGKIRLLHPAPRRLNQELLEIAENLLPDGKVDLISNLKSIQLILQLAEQPDRVKIGYVNTLLEKLERNS
jgi:hypothetical protein